MITFGACLACQICSGRVHIGYHELGKGSASTISSLMSALLEVCEL